MTDKCVSWTDLITLLLQPLDQSSLCDSSLDQSSLSMDLGSEYNRDSSIVVEVDGKSLLKLQLFYFWVIRRSNSNDLAVYLNFEFDLFPFKKFYTLLKSSNNIRGKCSINVSCGYNRERPCSQVKRWINACNIEYIDNFLIFSTSISQILESWATEYNYWDMTKVNMYLYITFF